MNETANHGVLGTAVSQPRQRPGVRLQRQETETSDKCDTAWNKGSTEDIMKTIIAATIVCALALMVQSQTNTPQNPQRADCPVTGMSVVDLAAFLNEIKLEMPVGPRIIGVSVRSESRVEIRTRNKPIKGPLSGSGEIITYTKQNGKWTVTDRSTWIS
jgi:hypothetical protein